MKHLLHSSSSELEKIHHATLNAVKESLRFTVVVGIFALLLVILGAIIVLSLSYLPNPYRSIVIYLSTLVIIVVFIELAYRSGYRRQEEEKL